ncbi:MAG: response regulator [Acidobacteriota bacterium]|nr:response regulator [Acidobacteriota bacterium]
MSNASIATQKRRSVLVVEDDRGIAQGLRALLISRGFVVDVEADPDAALRRVSERTYHVVVADFDLGDQDGLDLVRRVRDLCPKLPILAVTAIDRADALRASEDLELQGCFEKPVDPEQLMDAVTSSALDDR